MKRYFISGYNYIQDVALEPGTYTFWAYIKSEFGNTFTFALANEANEWEVFDVDVQQGSWTKAYEVFAITEKKVKLSLIYRYFDAEHSVYVLKPQLIKGNIPSDAGASPFDIDKVTDDLHDAIGSIEDFTNDEFADRVLSSGERVSLRRDLEAVEVIFQSLKGSYEKLLINPFVNVLVLADLTAKYNAVSSAKDQLFTTINTIIDGDNIVTPEEIAAKDASLLSLNNALYDYNMAEKELQNALGEDYTQKIGAIRDFTDTEFADRMLSETERVSLRHDLDNVQTLLDDITASYNEIVLNPYLTVADITLLTDKYNALFDAWDWDYDIDPSKPDGLKTVILDIINGDEIVTQAEIDEKDLALSNFNVKLGEYSTTEAQMLKFAVDNIQIGGINIISNLPENWENGYWGASGNPVAGNNYIRLKNVLPVKSNQRYVAQTAISTQITIRYVRADNTVYTTFSNRTFGVTTPLLFTIPGDVVGIKIYLSILTPVLPQVITEWKLKIEEGDKATTYSPSPGDVQAEIAKAQQEATAAAQSYSDAKANLAEIQAKSYADGIVDAEEQRAIADAQAKLDAAKAYADAQDNVVKTTANAYADGVADAAEQAAISEAQAYANLKKLEAQAYADGIVDAEEQRAIADAQAKLNEAKAHSQELVNNIQVGGRNLALNSKGEFGVAVPITTTEPLNIGDTYTLSFDVIGNANGVVFINNSITTTYDPSGTGWRRKSVTFTFIKNDYLGHEIFPHIYNADSVKNVKLEKGNKATDWTPAPEDVQAEIDAAQLAADGYMKARYVRDWIQGSTLSTNNVWREINVIRKDGTNVAQGKTPSSNGTFNASYPAANATDNNINTYAQINGTTPATSNYVEIDLGQIYNDIDYIQIWHDYTDERTFYGTKTEISVDGVTWTTIYDSATMGTYKETIGGKTHSQRYNRIVSEVNRSKAITDKFGTRIDGGLISTVITEYRELDSPQVTGLISGIQGTNKDLPFLVAGGTYNDALSGTAKAIIRHDGSVKFTDGEFHGTIYATDGVFSGTINATSGTIGGFNIDASSIKSTATTSGINKILLDGSTGAGHLAAGKFTWDADGNISVEGLVKTPFMVGNYPNYFDPYSLRNYIFTNNTDYTVWYLPEGISFNGVRIVFINWRTNTKTLRLTNTRFFGQWYSGDTKRFDIPINGFCEMIGISIGTTFQGWLITNSGNII